MLAGLAGLARVVACFVRFVGEGRGTPAPIAPTEELAFRSLSLVVWLAVFTAAVTVFVVAYEQPTLRAQYGASYDAYCGNVPAVLPRLRRRTRSTT